MTDTLQNPTPPWRRDEKQIVSITDYLSVEQVRQYDQRMRTVRDVDSENQNLLSRLNLPVGAKVLEIGTGTGAFARAAAATGLNVVAIDASPVMLEYAKSLSIDNFEVKSDRPARLPDDCMTGSIEFQLNGFLSFTAPENTFDAVVSSLCLHHLPDVWKAEACVNIHRWLKQHGVFLLVDVIYDCDGGQLDSYLKSYIPDDMNEQMKQALYGHIREENSTFSWIMESILQRSGLTVASKEKFGTMAHIFSAIKL